MHDDERSRSGVHTYIHTASTSETVHERVPGRSSPSSELLPSLRSRLILSVIWEFPPESDTALCTDDP